MLAKIGHKAQNGHSFGCKRHMHAEFGFEIGFVPSRNSSVTLPYTRDKGTLPWQPILEEKLLSMHMNAFVRGITRTRLLITGGLRGRPIQRRHFWLQGTKGRCHGNQILTKIGKNHKNGTNLSDILPLVHSTLYPCKLIDSNSALA